MRRSQSGKHTVRLVHVDTTQLDLKHEFKLSRVQPPDDGDSGETIYKLKPSEEPSQDIQVKNNFSLKLDKINLAPEKLKANFKYSYIPFCIL